MTLHRPRQGAPQAGPRPPSPAPREEPAGPTIEWRIFTARARLGAVTRNKRPSRFPIVN
jgi:hypothetical protein